VAIRVARQGKKGVHVVYDVNNSSAGVYVRPFEKARRGFSVNGNYVIRDGERVIDSNWSESFRVVVYCDSDPMRTETKHNAASRHMFTSLENDDGPILRFHSESGGIGPKVSDHLSEFANSKNYWEYNRTTSSIPPDVTKAALRLLLGEDPSAVEPLIDLFHEYAGFGRTESVVTDGHDAAGHPRVSTREVEIVPAHFADRLAWCMRPKDELDRKATRRKKAVS